MIAGGISAASAVASLPATPYSGHQVVTGCCQLIPRLFLQGGVDTAEPIAVVTDPGWKTHLRRLRAQLRERRDLLVASLREHAPRLHVDHVPEGGLHLWARLPDGTNTDRLVRDCETRGVYIASGHEWFPAEPSGPFLRLNFTGPNPNGFPAAARTISAALATQW
jgi:DNA-binding transcriptional MocR family regulator